MKWRTGYPLYSALQNNESFIYTPGAQLLTYFLAWLVGQATSIPAYRLIQVGFTLLAAVVATRCCRLLLRLSVPAGRDGSGPFWGAIWLPFLFLMASKSLTDPFVHNLHNDALAQLVSVGAYWLLLEYVSTRRWIVLAGMMLVPAAGFFVKQSLAIWIALYAGYLVCCDRPRGWARAGAFCIRE